MQKMLTCASTLLALALLSGCSKGSVGIVDTGALCQDWRHKTVSKSDKLTEKTASDLEADNASRENWGCEPGKNAAKS
jgi:hypothetical protein